MATKSTTKPITEAQINYITGILVPKVGQEQASELLLDSFSVVSIHDLSVRDASKFIDLLKREQSRQSSEKRIVAEAEKIVASATLEQGVYMRNGTPVRVYPSQRGHLLAKALIDGNWVYQGAAYRFVTADMKMTVEEANQYGLAFDICACCGRTLTATDSLYRGIGPVCFKKHF